MLIAFCQRSSCIARKLSRNPGLRPSNHLWASSMRSSVLQHSFASSRKNDVRESSKPTCSYSSRTHVWAGLHYSPDSFLGATTAHSIPHADARKLTFLCGEQTCMRSSAPLLPHLSANSLGRCVWPQPCSKVVEGPCSRSRLRCRCAG